MQTTSSPIVRRRELGALLKALRTEKGWTAEQVAERLLVSPSKISRLENGHRGASARDIRDLCHLYGVDDDERQRLLELARQGKQRAWWQPLGLPYSTYVGLEEAADLDQRLRPWNIARFASNVRLRSGRGPGCGAQVGP